MAQTRDSEEIAAKFEEVLLESGFSKIPEEKKLHPIATICGLMYLYNLLEDKAKWYEQSGESEEVAIYLCYLDDVKPLTDEDIDYLSNCGIYYNSDDEYFYL